MKICLKLEHSQVERFVSKNEVTIGRSDKADFPVKDEALSRLHCLVELLNGEFFITDLNSTNGVSIDGKRIEPKVRTLFNTFMQLSIGPYECTVLDEDENSIQSEEPFHRPIGTSSHKTREHLAGQKESSTRTRIIKPDPSKQSKALMYIIPIVFGLGVWFFYFNGQEFNPEEVSEVVAHGKREIAKNIGVTTPDKFSSMAIYESLESKKSCSGMKEICEEFKISEEAFQGIVIDNREAYVFMQPSVFFNVPHLTYLNEFRDAEELMGHYVTLKSKLMEKMDNQELDQIHLLMINKENKITKVFRYHVNYFGRDSAERFKMVEQLGKAFQSKHLEDVAFSLQTIIPSQDYKTN